MIEMTTTSSDPLIRTFCQAHTASGCLSTTYISLLPLGVMVNNCCESICAFALVAWRPIYKSIYLGIGFKLHVQLKHPEEVKSALVEEENLFIVILQTCFKAKVLPRDTPKMVFSDAVSSLFGFSRCNILFLFQLHPHPHSKHRAFFLHQLL